MSRISIQRNLGSLLDLAMAVSLGERARAGLIDGCRISKVLERMHVISKGRIINQD